MNKKCLSMIYFSLYIYIYISCINYGNIAWAGIFQSKLKKKLLTKQKHAVRIIIHEEKETHARPLLKEIHTLKKFMQINVLKILTFIQKVKNTTIPQVFLNTFEEIEHKYPTRSSKYNFKQTPVFINYAKFSISS